MRGLLTGLFFLLMVLLSCRRSNPLPLHFFKWTYNAVTYTAAFDTAMLHSITPSGFPLIIAGLGPDSRYPGSSVFIKVRSFTVGNYTFDTTSGLLPQLLVFNDISGNSFRAASGSLVVTANQNNLFSGTFSAMITVIPGVIRPLTGEFANVRIY